MMIENDSYSMHALISGAVELADTCILFLEVFLFLKSVSSSVSYRKDNISPTKLTAEI